MDAGYVSARLRRIKDELLEAMDEHIVQDGAKSREYLAGFAAGKAAALGRASLLVEGLRRDIANSRVRGG